MELAAMATSSLGPLQRRHEHTTIPTSRRHGPSFHHHASSLPPSTPGRALALPRRNHNPSPRCLSTSTPDSSSTQPLPATRQGLVFDVGPPGSWDGGAVGSPVVKRFLSDDGERWLMWYHGKPPKPNADPPTETSIGLATSPDGRSWERSTASVLSRGTDWWAFDTSGVMPAEVLVMSSDRLRLPSSVYWMYYTGLGSGGPLPGLAISQDGRHWARIEGEHHSGALFGGDGVGASRWGSSPCVVHRGEGGMRMYYHARDEERGVMEIRAARSKDGMEWVDAGRVEMEGELDDTGIMSPSVVEDADGYVMAYEREGGRGIGLARSGNGLERWRRVGDILRKGREGQWDEEQVGSPYLVRTDAGDWRLYYAGVGSSCGKKTGIGLAVGDARRDGEEFRRWEGSLLPIM